MSGTVLSSGGLAQNELDRSWPHKFLYWMQHMGFVLQPILFAIFIDNSEEQIQYMFCSCTEDRKDKGELKILLRFPSWNVKDIWEVGHEQIQKRRFFFLLSLSF